MRNKKIILAILCVSLLSMIFSACSNEASKETPDKASTSDSGEPVVLSDASAPSSGELPASEEAAPSIQVPSVTGQLPNTQPPAQEPAQAPAQEDAKYGKDDVYTNDSGVPAAKTESGTEVELTGENMQSILEEYQKIQGSGTERERELLDQLQVLLETMQFAQGN